MAEPALEKFPVTHEAWGGTLTTIDLHAAGEPARVVISGLPQFPGSTMAEKRQYIMENADIYRKILLQEPRGYPCQNANLIFPAASSRDPQCPSFGFVILEQNRIYPMMSGFVTNKSIARKISSRLTFSSTSTRPQLYLCCHGSPRIRNGADVSRQREDLFHLGGPIWVYPDRGNMLGRKSDRDYFAQHAVVRARRRSRDRA